MYIYSYGAENITKPAHGFVFENNPSIELIKTTQFLHDFGSGDNETPQQKREKYTKIITNIKKKKKLILLSEKKSKKTDKKTDKEKKSRRKKRTDKDKKNKKTKTRKQRKHRRKDKKNDEYDESGYETPAPSKSTRRKKIDYTQDGEYEAKEDDELDFVSPRTKRKVMCITSMDSKRKELHSGNVMLILL